MSQNPDRYRQLALFSVIVAEVVVTPSALGGGFYWLLKNTAYAPLGATVGAVLGFVVGCYRVFLITKRKPSGEK